MTDRSLQGLPGFGPKRRAALAACGVNDCVALLHWAPRLIPDASDELAPGKEVRFTATVERVKQAYIRRRGAICTATLRDDQGQTWTARWFKSPWVAKHLRQGQRYCWQGRCGKKQLRSLAMPAFSPCEADHQAASLLYDNLPAGIGAQLFTQAICHALSLAEGIVDPLGLVPAYGQVLRDLHQAADASAQAAARAICAERELVAIHLAQQDRRRAREQATGHRWPWSDAAHAALLAAFPFALRSDQVEVVDAIRADCAAPWPMQRLVQGEVGSGKTAVALAAALGVAAAGGLTILLAPTTLLAEQHLQAASRLAIDLGPALLTQETDAQERQRIAAAITAGDCSLLIGTHALFSDQTALPRLALVIIDEQQRFGVDQRAALQARQPAWQVDRLLLSATPIPRSLARCFFGDTAFSHLQPAPRQIRTELRSWPSERLAVYRDLATIADDDCAFVIVPRREGDDGDLPAVDTVAAELATTVPDRAIVTIHGGDDEQRKQAILSDLRHGRAQILVATTVVEVGIDLPQARVLVVLNAERYGLAQLHQLRGRVGRDGRDGLAVFCSPDPGAMQRLRILVEEDDGLRIAERDLRLRGPGDLGGTRQHGMPLLRCADLQQDMDLLPIAAERCKALPSAAAAQLRAIFPA